MILPVGKLPPELLDSLLKLNLGRVAKDRNIIVGPSIGEDAAVLDTGGSTYLVAKSDPITFATTNIGSYAVHVNANDIATTGGKPRWFLATILLPENATSPELAKSIFADMLQACDSLGVTLVGGHTEITHGLSRPIISGHMLGEVDKKKLVRTAGAQPGDVIVLTKGFAIEGTALLAAEKSTELEKALGHAFVSSTKKLLQRPGISVVKDARVATAAAAVHCMHDPTEGGVATGLREIAQAASVGIAVYENLLPILRETREVCSVFGINPLGLIASGSLLLTVPESSLEPIMRAFKENDIDAYRIGRVLNKSAGVRLVSHSEERDLPIFERDEITKVL